MIGLLTRRDFCGVSFRIPTWYPLFFMSVRLFVLLFHRDLCDDLFIDTSRLLQRFFSRSNFVLLFLNV
jgi:hypothetical protein